MANGQSVAIPEGATVGEQQKSIAIPQGATVGDAPQAASTSPTDDAAARHLRSRGITNPTAEQIAGAKTAQTSDPAKVPQTGFAGVATGVAKSAAQTISTVTNLANKALPSAAQIPDIALAGGHKKGDIETHGAAEGIGAGIENVGEFAVGEGVLKELTTALKLKNVGAITKLIQQYPRLAPMAIEGMKAFGLGTSQAALHGEQHPVESGAFVGVTGAAGEGASQALMKWAGRSVPKAWEAVNRYIGLNKSDLPRWERFDLKDAQEVGKTVLEKVGLKGSLEEQHAAIEVTNQNYNQRIDAMLQNVKGKLVPLQSKLNQIQVDLGNKIILEGRDVNGAATKALMANAQEMLNVYPPNLSVSQALELRKTIGRTIEWGSKDTSNVRNEFLKSLYHEMNDSIKTSLPPDVAKKFSEYNRIQNRLIIARDAAGEKLVNQATSKTPGIASKTASLAKRAAAGAAVGAGVGALRGKEGAEEGATIGAVVGATGHYGRHLIGESDLPVRDIQAQLIKSKALPLLAKAAKKSPAAARALAAITASHGGGSGSLSSQY